MAVAVLLQDFVREGPNRRANAFALQRGLTAHFSGGDDSAVLGTHARAQQAEGRCDRRLPSGLVQR